MGFRIVLEVAVKKKQTETRTISIPQLVAVSFFYPFSCIGYSLHCIPSLLPFEEQGLPIVLQFCGSPGRWRVRTFDSCETSSLTCKAPLASCFVFFVVSLRRLHLALSPPHFHTTITVFSHLPLLISRALGVKQKSKIISNNKNKTTTKSHNSHKTGQAELFLLLSQVPEKKQQNHSTHG